MLIARLIAVKFTLLALATITWAQPSDVRQGLVAYWPLDETDGAITPDAIVKTFTEIFLNGIGVPVTPRRKSG